LSVGCRYIYMNSGSQLTTHNRQLTTQKKNNE
jgi:hypothetical protein